MSQQTECPPLELLWATARDEFQEALAARYGAAFTSTAFTGWHKDTLGGYLRQVKRLARTEKMRPGDGPRAVLECRLLAIAQDDQSESSAKSVL